MREALSSASGGPSRLLESMDSVDAWEPRSGTAESATSDPTPTKDEPDPASDTPPERSGTGFLLEAVTGSAVVLCLAASLLHVLLVFLHVAPPNVVSERYSIQINGWIYPLFEQSWRLFHSGCRSR